MKKMYPPAIGVSRAISKFSSFHVKKRVKFFESMEVLVRPFEIEHGQFLFLQQAIQVPLVVFVRLLLPAIEMHRLRRALRVIRDATDVTRVVIKDAHLRKPLTKTLKSFCRALEESQKEIAAACVMSRRCVDIVSKCEKEVDKAPDLAEELKGNSYLFRGRALEAGRGGPFGSKKYRRDLEKKAEMFHYAGIRVVHMKDVLEYEKSLVENYEKVLDGVQGWVKDYLERGKKLHEDLKKKEEAGKKKKDSEIQELRNRYNLYLDEGRVLRLAMDKFYSTAELLRRDLGVVPEMINDEEMIRGVIQQFLLKIREQLSS